MKREVVSADGIPLSFDARGAGTPTLVFVHGWSCDRTYWDRQMDHFARSHEVVAVDLAGHGESGRGRAEWTMRAFGSDVVAVVDSLGLKETVLIGHSMGGDVIVEAARTMPGRVQGLVWVDTYRTLGKPRTREDVERFVAPFRVDFVAATRKLVRDFFTPRSNKDLVEWVVADMSAAPPEVAVGALKAAIGFEGEILALLREVRAPLVAMNPDHRPTDVEALRRHGIDVVIISGVGHFPMMEAPAEFNRVLGGVIAGFGHASGA